MISGPILEELLLSQKAVYRNISVGGAGLIQVRVPEGKTWIVTKIHILPFLNIITPSNEYADNGIFIQEVLSQNFTKIFERIQYQLLFYTPRLNSVYNIRNKIGLETFAITGDDNTAPHIRIDDQFFECFHLVGDNFYLFLKYFNSPDLNTDLYASNNYGLTFDGSQNWAESNPYGYSNNVNDISGYAFDFTYTYTPQNVQVTPLVQNQEQFILPSGNTSQPYQNFIPPILPGSASIDLKVLPSIPFYNLTVIEINKRLTTNGIL